MCWYNLCTDRQGHTDIDDTDQIQYWLDRCYNRWKKSHYWALQIALALVWLPVALQLLYVAVRDKIDPILYVQLSGKLIQLQSISPVVNMLIALAVTTAAASCFRFEPGVEQMNPKQPDFHLLRSNVRIVTYSWFIKLMFIPCLASFLIWYSPMVIPNHFNPVIPGHRWGFVAGMLLMFLVSCWIGAEFSQYMNLRFNSKPVWKRVFAVVTTVLVYLALVFFGQLIFGQNPSGAIKVLSEVYSGVLTLTPLGAALYMMLATRKPTPAMLEQL